MPIHELAALGAATCWALTGLVAVGPASHLGAPAFNRARQVFVTVILAIYVLVTGGWEQILSASLLPLLVSGAVGIFVGDTLLFAGLNRLGPRRSGIVYALNAPIAALLSFVVLGETLSPRAMAGIGITMAGVVIAILYRRGSGNAHAWETVKGPLWLGVVFGLGAATCQAVGSIIARPVMASGIDPFLASMVRVGMAALCLSALMALPVASVKPKGAMTARVALLTAITGTLGLAIGMTLLLFALSGGQVGIVSTLSATSPVIILPLIWAATGERPAAGAWAGALLVVIGMAFLFMR